MRIIQLGKRVPPQEEMEMGHTCRYCETHFGFFPREATLIHDMRDGDYYSLFCPACKRQVTQQKRAAALTKP